MHDNDIFADELTKLLEQRGDFCFAMWASTLRDLLLCADQFDFDTLAEMNAGEPDYCPYDSHRIPQARSLVAHVEVAGAFAKLYDDPIKSDAFKALAKINLGVERIANRDGDAIHDLLGRTPSERFAETGEALAHLTAETVPNLSQAIDAALGHDLEHGVPDPPVMLDGTYTVFQIARLLAPVPEKLTHADLAKRIGVSEETIRKNREAAGLGGGSGPRSYEHREIHMIARQHVLNGGARREASAKWAELLEWLGLKLGDRPAAKSKRPPS